LEAPFRQGDVNHVTGDVHFLTILLSKKKTLLTIHDCGLVFRLQGIRYWIVWFFWLWLPVSRSGVVTVISNFTKKELLGLLKCDPEKIRVVPDPVLDEFKFEIKKFDSDNPVILQVGTTEHNKNIERVAESLRGIKCRLRVIGQLSQKQDLALRKNGVEFTSAFKVSDQEMLDEYRHCDMLVFASTYEGFGMPILEAQAVGRPVVTSRVGPMPEVASDGACLVDPFDSNDIRRGILRVMEDPDYRDDLIQKGLANIRRFQCQSIADEYLRIYRELQAKPKREKVGEAPLEKMNAK
jgi:glycosyltransferase involved in cell wall biosynthesis